MNPQPSHEGPLVLSYLDLRKTVGIIGLALPFVVAIGKILWQGPGIELSISDYYYTTTRNILVGSLCVIGVFLMSTKGYDRKDEIAGYLAGIFAIGTALFPTTPAHDPTSQTKVIGFLHYAFAALLFLTFAYFSVMLFTRTAPNKTATRQKLHRNKVYRVCGYTILGCILLIAAVKLLPVGSFADRFKPVFWLETVAIVTFGLAWFTKGEAILKDQKENAKTAAAGHI